MYSNKVNEIFKTTPNSGGLQGANGVGKYVDEVCGDCIKIYLKIDENEIIKEARFKSMGSVGVIVASSAICDLVLDLSISEAQALTASDILEVLGQLPEDKLYALDFVIRTLSLAIADYYQKLEKENKQPKNKKSEEKEENASALKQTELIEPAPNDDFDKKFNEENLVGDEDESYEEITDDEYDAFEDELFEQDLLLNAGVPEEKAPVQTRQDAVDKFLMATEEKANQTAKQSIDSREKVTITKTTEEFTSIKATRMVEESRTFTPVVETKIIKDEDMPKVEQPTVEEVNDGEKSVSKAKALFDSLFDE